MPAKFRLRPTVLQLIRQGDLPQIKELCAGEQPSLQLLDVFIREASRLQQTEILVYFMNQKQGMDLAKPAAHLTKPDLCLQIWNLTREQLSVKYPFLRSYLWYFTFRTSTETTTAGTDGSVIYFSHDFLLRLFRSIHIQCTFLRNIAYIDCPNCGSRLCIIQLGYYHQLS